MPYWDHALNQPLTNTQVAVLFLVVAKSALFIFILRAFIRMFPFPQLDIKAVQLFL